MDFKFEFFEFKSKFIFFEIQKFWSEKFKYTWQNQTNGSKIGCHLEKNY